MFRQLKKTYSEMQAKLAALDKSQAVIEFDMKGVILTANENFLNAVGYHLKEIQGQHHSMFVLPDERNGPEYQQFWASLNRGEFQSRQYRRLAKGGKDIWIEASYNPLFDSKGKPYKVVKYATDITAQKTKDADLKSQIAALHNSQAVIEFDLNGYIFDANENFLVTTGYSLSEIKGKHHNMFVEPSYAKSVEYQEFWKTLASGNTYSAQYKRFGKNQKEIWLEASYNPILDASGKPYKVIKFAMDITQQVQLLSQLREMIEKNFSDIDAAIIKSGQQSNITIQTAQQTSSNVEETVDIASQIALSISEISQSMTTSRTAVDTAYDKSESASELTQKLSSAATSMSGIIALIQTIAAQINLLALNATIESARAGEAGRGFAVVANEVKSLANQVARATEQIVSEINSVQSISTGVVDALSGIKNSVETVRDCVVSTASAIEEQSVITQNMSSNMREVSQAVSMISNNIADMSGSVQTVSDVVNVTKEAAKVLVR